MHIYFSGIGGAGIGPLALVAKQAGYTVSGSDKQDSQYIKYLHEHGITNIHIGQDRQAIASVHDETPIDWYVYSSAVAIEQPDAPEFEFCREQAIKMTKRDELLNQILQDKQLKLIAVAGTHGKTTTTAMTVWLLKQLGIPIGYILPAKSSFAEMGAFEEGAEYFVYEADEFDRNFLAYQPTLSLITGIDWDHPDIYPTREDYYAAFREFIEQSVSTYLWKPDADLLEVQNSPTVGVINVEDYPWLKLPGAVNRQNGALVAQGVLTLLQQDDIMPLTEIIDTFPGISRRFEQIIPGLYSDYAHTPPKIAGALQLGHEVAGTKLVVVYEGLHNTRQHFIKDQLVHLFDSVKQLYIVPTYLAREDPNLAIWSPEDLKQIVSPNVQKVTVAADRDEQLKQAISDHLAAGDTVLCLTAGGGNSLDEWLRATFVATV